MLHQFTFKNFKSFKNEVTLDLLASSIKEHPSDVVNDIFDEKVLKVAAIYGANASGKSNVLNAFETMRFLVVNSFKNNFLNNKDIEPYWFEDKAVPTEFNVLFSVDKQIYQYGFSFLKDKIIEEFLYMRDHALKKENYIELFKRTGNHVSGSILDIAETQVISKMLSEDTLLISVMSKLNINHLKNVYDWFKEVRIVDYGNPRRELQSIHYLNSNFFPNKLIQLLENQEEKEQLENFIKAIDVGIAKLGIVEDVFQISDEESNVRKRVVSYHRNPNTGKLFMTPMSSESSGTLKMILLYTDLKRIMDSGGTIFIDELDAKLHPLLLRYVIIMFHNKNINKKNAQLIFSTQEVFTLDKSNFRRDEIWFTDKNKDGISDLYSLDSYTDNNEKKVRNDASYGKDYILGRYKSIPSLKRMEDTDD
ncbi:ATP-binding protein [Ligilactobacillus sp. WILCCON 0076]|uniref:ATP-binding protein n=1 Tax=Ligilactobacillus ubinensis TaxID=2876789 RepID=A0A9X2FK97_9LACO|nr:ATP-binding protein [Ligilactobacillus ubinensis]MCP0887132.1 ATP-binding protein [Ligilactobacillus ubinensis]